MGLISQFNGCNNFNMNRVASTAALTTSLTKRHLLCPLFSPFPGTSNFCGQNLHARGGAGHHGDDGTTRSGSFPGQWALQCLTHTQWWLTSGQQKTTDSKTGFSFMSSNYIFNKDIITAFCPLGRRTTSELVSHSKATHQNNRVVAYKQPYNSPG